MVLSRAEIEAERCKRDFTLFVKQAWPIIEPGTPYVSGWHIDAIILHLEALARGTIKRLLVNMPPRHAKSSIISVLWPVWMWLQNPSIRFLCASYDMPLAVRDNRKCRLLIRSEWFQERFGNLFQLRRDQNEKCLLGSTKISTDKGEFAIQDIVEQKMNVRVLTFNHEKSIIENKHILDYEKHPGRPCVQVLCSNGAKIICTLNHPFYVRGKGYVEAQYLQAGDTVY